VKRYFAQLRPLERRLAVAVLVALLLVLNYIFIWPHFSDWSQLQNRLENAQQNLKLFQTAIAQSPKYAALVKKMEGEGAAVAPEDQAINFVRTIQSQSTRSGVGIVSMPRMTPRTNEFFVTLTQNLNLIADDQQLVDFLYHLGSDPSMIRVSEMELQPDPPHQHLSVRIQLVASYQKTSVGKDRKNTTAKSKLP
jgi:type II secretory pathway component PulM